MNRRKYLSGIAAGITIGVAGCTGDGTSTVAGGDNGDSTPTPTDTGSGRDSTETGTATESPTETETDSPTPGSAKVSIANAELKKYETSYSTEAYVAADIVNEGDSPSGAIELTARFYDSEGNLLENGLNSLVRLKPGETWKATIWFLGDGTEAADFEIEGEFAESPPNFSPDGIELTGSEMSKTSDEATITGTLKNATGDTVDYMEAHGLFYADDTTILASDYTNQTDIPDGDTWKFEVSMRNQFGRLEQVSSHEVVYTISVY